MHPELSSKLVPYLGWTNRGMYGVLNVNQELVGICFEQRIQGFAGFLTGGV